MQNNLLSEKQFLTNIALNASKLIASHKDSYEPEVSLKNINGLGNIGSVSKADYASQKYIIETICSHNSNAYFITEEKEKNSELVSKVLDSSNYLEELHRQEVFCIDPLDGSTAEIRGVPTGWSVSIGKLNQGKPVSGLIYNPEAGLLVYGTNDSYEAMNTDNGIVKPLTIKKRNFSNPSIAYIGVDFLKSKYFVPFKEIINQVGDSFTSTLVASSCAAAILNMVVGKADLVIQPLQSSWDYLAGHVIVNALGGKTHFYTISDDGFLVWHDSFKPEFANPDKRIAGFVMSIYPELADNWKEKIISQKIRLSA